MEIAKEHQEKGAAKFRFGVFEADPQSGELRKSGMRIRIQAQPFRVLIFLLERAGQIVSREEIQQQFWAANTMVDMERSLATAIHKIRECLGDTVGNPRFIETLARSGYRFIAPVHLIVPAIPDRPATVELNPSPPSHTELQPLPAPAKPAGISYPIGSVRFWSGIALLGALAVIGAYLAEHRAEARLAIPPHVAQVTFSNRVSPGDLFFESFPGTATDGSRIYFTQIENGRPVLAEVLIANGQTGILPLPEELATPSVDGISPDGFQLLLRNHLATSPEQALWIASTIGGAARRIPGILAHAATWMPDGQHILYATGNDLYIARDNGTESRKLITLPGRAFWMRWSPDGSKLRLTLVNDETHISALWELSADGSDAHMLLGNWNRMPAECCGSWTSDGKYYVFQSTEQGESNIWAIPGQRSLFEDSAKPVPITNGPLDYQAPITARDGHRIFFIGLDPKSELLQFEARSHSFVPYSSSLRNVRRVEFSRDGKWIAWIRQSDSSLWRSRSDGSAVLQLTARPMQVFRVQWSPDDRQLVLMARSTGQPWKMYMADAENGHLQPVLNEDHSEADPNWSPDGKSLVFGRSPERMAEPSQPKAIYMVDLATKQVTKLPGSDGLFSPRWSANGRYIAALSIDQTRLMLYDVAAKTWRQLAQQNIDDPTWSHDDNTLFFHDFAKAGQPIYKVTLTTGKVEQVTDMGDLHLANVVDYRFAGLAPGDIPLVNAIISAADLYSADLPH
ncbi:winged helix-turn-helix domain-containing protein [Edaphobacter paludis]|uniref:Winged helix-turn-helix domain-containing protein n=1 Tax=Edaphobacter paludis TaxID=3035702 RepID=A0AAU7D6E9_9BACT